MKTTKGIILVIAIIAIVSCKKDTKTITPTPVTSTPDNYSSVKDFFSKNGVAMQTYTVNGNTGGSFTSPQGTTVTIPANAFLTQANVPVTGSVTIQFKDIYTKSDMLLSDKTTMTYLGNPLKSGGEFFFKAISNNSGLILASGKSISVNQPSSLTGGLDSINIMLAFVGQDSSSVRWIPSTSNSVANFTNAYVYSLYQGSAIADSGTWCNSDNSSYFSAYTQTSLTLVPNDNMSTYSTQVFLVFKNISSMIHVMGSYSNNNFPYLYAPQGLQCTMVAVGIKYGGTVYSSFVPITIGSNQSVNFSLSATTTSAFVTQLKTLN